MFQVTEPPMFPRIVQVEHIDRYILRLVFTDGQKGEIDFESRIANRGGVFGPLEDIEFFSKVMVDPEAHTLIWPNGVDLDPDVLYSEASGTPLPVPQST